MWQKKKKVVRGTRGILGKQKMVGDYSAAHKAIYFASGLGEMRGHKC